MSEAGRTGSDVAIVAAGMVSALGFDWRHACAAARAGIRRASAIDGHEALSAIDGEQEPVTGHACGFVTEGFEGSARLLGLLAAGLADLLAHLPELAHCGSETGFVLVLGPRQRTAGGAALLEHPAPAAAPAFAATDSDDVAPPVIDTDRAALLELAAQSAGFESRPLLLRCWEDDDTSVVVALEAARRWIVEGRYAQIVVIAADSLLEPDCVAWLENTGRLKASGMPAGLEPGEACAALVLAAASAARGSPLGWLVGTAFAVEEATLLEGGSSTGSGTATLLRELAVRSPWAQHEPAWIVSDHNGEPYRANDLALALARASTAATGLGQARLEYPALHFGDTGAARTLVGACTVLAAFERGYAPAPLSCLVATSDGGRRAAALLARA